MYLIGSEVWYTMIENRCLVWILYIKSPINYQFQHECNRTRPLNFHKHCENSLLNLPFPLSYIDLQKQDRRADDAF